ncbi:putative transcription factor interactor and regulator Znf-B family [Helianthus debilis subsp. tardiflorus]
MMKIQCNVCESVEATVFCCADDAALCRSCDEKIHAANRLASKHQRVHLSNFDNQRPKCDICQVCIHTKVQF